jgi:ribosomal protein S24E
LVSVTKQSDPLLSVVEVVKDSQNELLGRRELSVKFIAGSGILTRKSAAEAIASRVAAKVENVQVISLTGRFGVRDVDAIAYVFDSPDQAKKQLAEYVLLRHYSKEDRKKIREEKRKAATAGPSATAVPSGNAEKKT